MKVQMKNNLIELYEKALPGELEAQGSESVGIFLKSIEGKKVELIFTGGDAFEKTDNNIWLPDSLWMKIEKED